MRNKTKRELSWSWLAFGIFYPTSAKLTANDTPELIEVYFDVAHPEWTAAISSVASDPVGALLKREVRNRGPELADHMPRR